MHRRYNSNRTCCCWGRNDAPRPKPAGSLKADRPHNSPQETDHHQFLERKDYGGGNTNSASGQEMVGCGIEVLGISETRWKGMGSRTLQGSERVAYVGDEGVQQGGVPILMSVRTKRALMEWMPICMRTIKARFYSKHKS